MKLFMAMTAAAAATVLVGAAMGAESDKFVIRGDAAKQLLEQNSINIATAEAIAKACVDEANKEGVKVSIAIYDQYGEPVYMYRMDGQARIAIETAIMKAKTVLNTRQCRSSGRLGSPSDSVRQFRQFRRPTDRDQRQPVHRRHRHWRLRPQGPGLER